MTRDKELAEQAAFARYIGILRCPDARDIAGDRVADVNYYLSQRKSGTLWLGGRHRPYRPPFEAERIKDTTLD